MRLHRLVLFAGLTILMAVGVSAQNAPRPAAVPVVIELFTSEGCSSCPPADELLAILMKEQPVPGARIIALGEHVDYWDRLGWRDQFSSAQFTARQNEYAARAFHTDNIYTPQLIVNGTQEVLGSDARAAAQAIAKAAQRQPSVTVTVALASEKSVQLQASVAPSAKIDEPTEMLLAITEEGLGSHVLRGENKGKDLQHGTVLRSLVPVGTMAAKDASWSATKTVSLDKDWNPGHLQVIAIAQAKNSRRILGAAAIPFQTITPTK
jgi:hypothetical protein